MYRPIALSLNKIAACMILASGIMVPAQTPSSGASQTQQPPISWIDPSTGHRITRLTDQPGSRGLYFNHTAFTPDGKQMVYCAGGNIYLVELSTRKSRLLVSGPVIETVVSKNASVVYFMKVKDQHVYMADISTGELSQVAVLPDRATISTINADGTLIAGAYIDGPGQNFSEVKVPSWIRPTPTASGTLRMESKLPMVLFTLDMHTGTVTSILHSTDWLNHVQFSPTDPTLLMYCHEGSWQDVDRIWTIRADGTKNQLIDLALRTRSS